VPEYLSEAQGRMTDFLARVMCPDGDIPFFNDSTGSFFLDARETLERGRRLVTTGPISSDPSDAGAQQPHKTSGLLVYGEGALFLVFDTGDVGPDYQPGHAHCDTLSFEASLNGARVITDTGVYHYRVSQERAYCRSTAAHNTVSIDGQEQSEVWESFRVGRRAYATGSSRMVEGGMTFLRGAHDGFTRIARGLVHERCLAVGEDRFIAVVDWIHGNGRRCVTAHLHLHPDVRVRREGSEYACSGPSGSFRIIPPDGAETTIFETEYYPRFGVKVARQSLRFEMTCALPAVMTALIVFEGEAPAFRLDSSDGKVQIQNGPHDVTLLPMYR
jgi:uncharacterized heparinase superfamily protein